MVWLADFGTARLKTRQSLESTTENDVSHNIDHPGTAYYQAPEVQIHGRRAQPHSDVWTTSVVGTEWFTGKRPWRIRQLIDLITKKESECMPEFLHKVQDDNIRDLLTKCLSYDRRSRPTAAEVKTKLEGIKGNNYYYICKLLTYKYLILLLLIFLYYGFVLHTMASHFNI